MKEYLVVYAECDELCINNDTYKISTIEDIIVYAESKRDIIENKMRDDTIINIIEIESEED